MCAIDNSDYTFQFYTTLRPVRARKPHRCDECSRNIAAGETYYYAFGVFGGHGEGYHICAHCCVAVAWLQRNCGGFLHGGVQDDIEEHFREAGFWPVGRYVVGMLRRWQRRDGSMMRMPPQVRDYPAEKHGGKHA